MPIYGFKTSKRSKNSPIVNISPKLTLFENLYEYKFVPPDVQCRHVQRFYAPNSLSHTNVLFVGFTVHSCT